MVQMLFYVRFRGQFRRTKPELMVTLEDAVTEAAAAAGGEIENGRKVFSVSFDDGRISFWLDIVVFLEKVNEVLCRTASALYGYTLVLGRNIPEASAHKLCRFLCREHGSNSTGIWVSSDIRSALDNYLIFGRSAGGIADDIEDEYREFLDFRSFDGAGVSTRKVNPYRDKITRTLARGNEKNTVLLGPDFMGKRDAMYHYSTGLLGGIPPLVVRFGIGGFGLSCFADAYTPRIRAFIASSNAPEKIKILDMIHEQLFRERIREEWSPYLTEQAGFFFRSLLDAYISAAGACSLKGLLVLEALSLADPFAFEIIKEAGERILILASDSSSEENLKIWNGVFPRMLLFTLEDISAAEKEFADRNPLEIIPLDLWEAAFNILLLRRYFPPYLFPQLFEEEGFNRDIYFRALKMLSAFGVVVEEDVRPRVSDFFTCAGKIPEDRREKIRAAVRSRILAWALSGKLWPCYNLLKILAELGEDLGDVLILRSLRADILNGTCSSIEKALSDRSFAKLTGKGNAHVLSFVYKTLKVLVWGGKEEILKIFREPVPSMTNEDGKPCYIGCQSQVEINLASYYLGCRKIDAASEAIRKAMLLNRDLGKEAVPAYRLFALVNFFRQRINDALEYISFALDEEEKTDQSEELVLTCYFASSINFIYGNLSKAERLAKRAEETATALGQTRWALRSKFLRGRVCFEGGRYSDALDIFESLGLAETAENDASPSLMASTVYAWIFRTRNFLGCFFPADFSGEGRTSSEHMSALSSPVNYDNLTGLDAEIFRIEEAYMKGDYQKTTELADDFISSRSDKPEADFLFTEQPDWRSGFSQCESMFQSGKNPAARMAWVYRELALYALYPSGEKRGEILGDMQRFMREEFLPDTDSNDAFFFHAWYCMLRDSQKSGESGSAHVDINTVVSMAYKRLQRRAGRIDDAGIKQAFLNKSRWNGTLCLAAREYKLIQFIMAFFVPFFRNHIKRRRGKLCLN